MIHKLQTPSSGSSFLLSDSWSVLQNVIDLVSTSDVFLIDYVHNECKFDRHIGQRTLFNSFISFFYWCFCDHVFFCVATVEFEDSWRRERAKLLYKDYLTGIIVIFSFVLRIGCIALWILPNSNLHLSLWHMSVLMSCFTYPLTTCKIHMARLSHVVLRHERDIELKYNRIFGSTFVETESSVKQRIHSRITSMMSEIWCLLTTRYGRLSRSTIWLGNKFAFDDFQNTDVERYELRRKLSDQWRIVILFKLCVQFVRNIKCTIDLSRTSTTWDWTQLTIISNRIFTWRYSAWRVSRLN